MQNSVSIRSKWDQWWKGDRLPDKLQEWGDSKQLLSSKDQGDAGAARDPWSGKVLVGRQGRLPWQYIKLDRLQGQMQNSKEVMSSTGNVG